jgi:hypothetical protein
MHHDTLVYETRNHWRYICEEPGCYYRSDVHPMPSASLAMRIHRHRHTVGLAGVYHRAET